MVRAKFSIGQVVSHLIYGYQGMIIDADPSFSLSDDWYQRMADTKPEKNQPWYHILVHNSDIQTYVPEHSLMSTVEQPEILNPKIKSLFKTGGGQAYYDVSALN